MSVEQLAGKSGDGRGGDGMGCGVGGDEWRSETSIKVCTNIGGGGSPTGQPHVKLHRAMTSAFDVH